MTDFKKSIRKTKSKKEVASSSGAAESVKYVVQTPSKRKHEQENNKENESNEENDKITRPAKKLRSVVEESKEKVSEIQGEHPAPKETTQSSPKPKLGTKRKEPSNDDGEEDLVQPQVKKLKTLVATGDVKKSAAEGDLVEGSQVKNLVVPPLKIAFFETSENKKRKISRQVLPFASMEKRGRYIQKLKAEYVLEANPAHVVDDKKKADADAPETWRVLKDFDYIARKIAKNQERPEKSSRDQQREAKLKMILASKRVLASNPMQRRLKVEPSAKQREIEDKMKQIQPRLDYYARVRLQHGMPNNESTSADRESSVATANSQNLPTELEKVLSICRQRNQPDSVVKRDSPEETSDSN